MKQEVHPSDIVARMSYRDLSGMKIVFINMPLRESAKPNTPPQGPLLMAARLRTFGADPTILDLNAYRIKDAVSEKAGFSSGRHLSEEEVADLTRRHFNKYGQPDIIALSGMITTLRWQERVTKMCRGISPESFIISGGGLATEVKEGLFTWVPELDAIGLYEGDDIILVMAKEVKNAKMRGVSLSKTSSYFSGKVGGRDRFVYVGNRPKSLDELPFPALDLLEEDVDGNKVLEEYIATPVWGSAANNSSATAFSMRRSLTTVSSRGCPYACAFCYKGAQGERQYGMRSAENLAEEVRSLVAKYNIDFLGFPDDNFAVSRERVSKLPELFKGLNLRWGTHTRLDEADARIEDMAKAGCVYIGFGAESASQNVLRRMGKGGFILKRGVTKLPDFDFDFPVTMVEGIKNCLRIGIHSNCTWIMGYPGERLEDLKTSVSFILWQTGNVTHRDFINRKMFTATAYPGTKMFKEPKVRELLSKNFGISFDVNLNPVCDEQLRKYILELDDATKVLFGGDGRPLNLGDMSDDDFMQARQYIDGGEIEKILEM